MPVCGLGRHVPLTVNIVSVYHRMIPPPGRACSPLICVCAEHVRGGGPGEHPACSAPGGGTSGVALNVRLFSGRRCCVCALVANLWRAPPALALNAITVGVTCAGLLQPGGAGNPNMAMLFARALQGIGFLHRYYKRRANNFVADTSDEEAGF